MSVKFGDALSKKRLLCIVGLAFFWPSLHTSPYYPLSINHTSLTSTVAAISDLHVIYSSMLLFLLVLVLVFKNMLQAVLFRRRYLLFIFGILGCIGSLFVSASRSISATSGTVMTIGLFLFACYIVFYIFAWGVRITGEEAHFAILNIALSYVLYSIICSIWLLISGNGANYLPIFCPLISALCILASPICKLQSISLRLSSLKALPWQLIAPCLAFIIFGVLYIRILTGFQMGELATAHRLATALVALGIMIIVAVVIWKAPFGQGVLLSLFAFLAVCFLAAFLIMLVFGDDFTPGKRMFVAVEHSFEVYLWMILTFATIRQRLSPLLTFALFALTAVAIPQVASIDFIYQTNLIVEFSHFVASVPVAAIASFAVASAVIVLLAVCVMSVLQSTLSGFKDWQVLICKKAMSGAGLSPRELKVAILFYRGYSARRISENLYLSESTIKSHVAAIYQKLDIHSKQEYISFIDDFRDTLV
jgi:DNA-binding CsgD family transcriptional regulator